MSIKGKVASAAKKLIEATKAYDQYNKLEGKEGDVQCAFVIDAVGFSQIAGHGKMYERLLNNGELGYFSGKGKEAVEETDSLYRKNNVKVMRLTESNGNHVQRKRKICATGKYFQI